MPNNKVINITKVAQMFDSDVFTFDPSPYNFDYYQLIFRRRAPFNEKAQCGTQQIIFDTFVQLEYLLIFFTYSFVIF